MPETGPAQAYIDSLRDSYKDQLAELQKEYNDLLDNYDKQVKDWSPAKKADEEKKISNLHDRIVDFNDNATKDIQAQQEEKIGNIQKKLLESIKRVAKANNYTYVFDSSTMLYASESEDITPLIMKDLNLKDTGPSIKDIAPEKKAPANNTATPPKENKKKK
jgi:outer membrane protein